MTARTAAAEIVIITGMSGAGRSTAAKSLEDLDWFVADNVPPGLLPTMADLARRATGAVPRLAAVVDVRSRAFSTDLKSAIGELDARGVRPYVVFLEASDDTLVRRFDSVRRPHPLQDSGRVVDGIAAEREQLQGLRGQADLVLDTSGLNVHDLRARMRDAFGGEPTPRCGSTSSRSDSSTACRSTRTWSRTAASCPTRTGCPTSRR